MLSRRHWIPPLGLMFGQLCHGLSWLLALGIALRVGVETLSGPQLAWIHLVALGWFTVTAFSILLHAIPAFLEVEWRFQTAARWALAIAAMAILGLVASLAAALHWLGIVASVLAAALGVYLVTAFQALGNAARSADRIERAVARAFSATLAVFAIVVALGVAIAWLLAGAEVPAWFARVPAAHADLALWGWLTLLVYGVSARTLRPIAGNRSRWPKMHILVGSATLAGAPLLAIGAGLRSPWLSWLGGALVALGAVAYVTDVADILRRATVTHRPPQAFVGAALVWLVASIAVGAGVLAGQPWQAALVFLVLVGWIGQMVDAHIFHIGVRLLATIYRGDDDETPPEQLLDLRLEWISFTLFQCAIAALAGGLLVLQNGLCAIGAGIGFAGWIVLIAAVAKARARSLRGSLTR